MYYPDSASEIPLWLHWMGSATLNHTKDFDPSNLGKSVSSVS